jgi:hypothetical protein
MSNYIYLLQEREFITTNQKIYKLGKTKQENLQRFKQYPKGSKLLLQQVCDDCDVLEAELIRDFKNKYTHRRDIGNEYFEGDYNDMIKDIHIKITHNEVNNEDIDDEVSNEDIDCEDGNTLCNEVDNNERDYKLYIDDYQKWSQIHKCYNEKDINEIMQLTKSYNIMKNIEIKEAFSKRQPYIIRKYEDYKQISPTIQSIIITHKNKQKGYILLNSSKHWLIIYEYNHKIPIEEQECLLGWIKYHSKDEFQKDNIMYYTKEGFDEIYALSIQYGTRLDENSTPFCCDYDKIIKDICKTCFNDRIELYALQNYEYFISIDNCNANCILNTKTWQITDYNPNTDKLLTGCDMTSDIFYINKNTFQEIDTMFVNDAIKLLLGNNELYKQYKQLCYNIFVEHQKDITLIDDTYGLYGLSYISNWITNLLNCLLPVKSFIYISNDKYGEKVPNKYNNDIRLVIIKYNSDINKQVAKLQQLGYKNIIIMKNHHNNIPIAYNDFISENMVKIKQLSEVHTTKENHYNCLYIPYEVFDYKRLLLNNFLKWCCGC